MQRSRFSSILAKKRRRRGKKNRNELTRRSHPCLVCGHRVPRMLQPRPPPRERVGVAVVGAVDTEGVQAPYPRGVDCDGGREHPGRSRVDRTALHHLLHLRPRDNSSAALRRHTERKGKISSNCPSTFFCTRYIYFLEMQ